MANASIDLFCTANELEAAVEHVCKEFGVLWLTFPDGGGAGVAKPCAEGIKIDPQSSLFLIPPDDVEQRPFTDDNIRPRERGWIQIRSGLLVKNPEPRLLLTDISFEQSDSSLPNRRKTVRFLKKLLQRDAGLRYGVLGRNVATGGSSFYQNIGYTNGAFNLHRSGVLWMQFLGARGVFEPVPDMNMANSKSTGQP